MQTIFFFNLMKNVVKFNYQTISIIKSKGKHMRNHKLYLAQLFLIILITLFSACNKKDSSPVAPKSGEYSGAYGTVAGKFVAPSGDPIAGVEVSIVSNYTNLTKVMTDNNGEFTHTKVPVGSQTLMGSKGSFTATFAVSVQEGQTTNAPPVTIQPKNKLAFVYGSWDNIQDIIRSLGYSPDSLDASDLSNSSIVNVNNYSALFLNCGMEEYLDEPTKTNLTKFLNDGGLIYASDYASSYVNLLYPDKITFVKNGSSQTVLADVVDEQTRTNLGKSQISIEYNLSSWAEIDSMSTDFTIIVKGDYNSYDGYKTNKPLAVYKTQGKGLVVYTTFHNEANTTDDMTKILEEFIFF